MSKKTKAQGDLISFPVERDLIDLSSPVERDLIDLHSNTTGCHDYNVTLSEGQKNKLPSAIRKKEPVTLRLKNNQLTGRDEMKLTLTQIKKLQKAKRFGLGSEIKISKTQIKKSVKKGGSLYSSLASLAMRGVALAIKGTTKILPHIFTGALSSLGDKRLKKIFGQG